jgi:hypothetical protein
MNKIEIPIIASDLRQDEVCIRAIQTFEHLDKVIDEVFDKIDNRIEANMTRIRNVNQRFVHTPPHNFILINHFLSELIKHQKRLKP